ncbi:MAG TPA: fructosamine kinase family protein [Streptosporangiaceae bacterium]|nr:fructosamine kinase family protein [Streptosporangiaceae bacterium]
MALTHPLLDPAVRGAVARAASAHRGTPWTGTGFTDLGGRSSHPAGVFHGTPFPVFAKLAVAAGAEAQITAELAGLRLLHDQAGVATAVPVADGAVPVPPGWLLLAEALPERLPGDRTPADWRSIGRALATLHGVAGPRFGLATEGYFGPLPQPNAPVRPDRWATFYAERRLRPNLRLAADSGQLPGDLAAGVEQIIHRLPTLAGPEPHPALLHGDAQQHNFVSIPGGAVLIDPAPYFGHPELDLALLGYFHPVPRHVLDGYTEVRPVDAGFAARRELWRMFAYLAVLAVDGGTPYGRRFLARLDQAIAGYR